jgi:hypothetical protein
VEFGGADYCCPCGSGSADSGPAGRDAGITCSTPTTYGGVTEATCRSGEYSVTIWCGAGVGSGTGFECNGPEGTSTAVSSDCDVDAGGAAAFGLCGFPH